MEPIIEVKNVTKIYKVGTEKITALEDVNFSINRGDFCCLLGTSGSGKSTLLNLMAGIEKITKGEILIKGKNVCKMGEHQLAKFRQIILITHQAIIASKADKHFYIKKAQDTQTHVGVYVLTDEYRVKALAELAGGEITDQSIEFAKSLLNA